MMGGVLEESGYYPGEFSYPPRFSNPKGFFEDKKVNDINERIMISYDQAFETEVIPENPKRYNPFKPRYGHHWLAYVPRHVKIELPDIAIGQEIVELLSRKEPYAYKDPRFNYTLPVWEPFLSRDTRFICMFRNPSATIKSVIEECKSADYLSEFYIEPALCYRLWANAYRYILENLLPVYGQRMLFVSYDALLQTRDTSALSLFLEKDLNIGFIEVSLNRSERDEEFPEEVGEVYRSLLSLSGQL
jgi:hypothetical protein